MVQLKLVSWFGPPSPFVHLVMTKMNKKKQASSYEEFTNQLHTLAQEYEDSRYFVLVPKDGFLPANIDDEDDEDDDDDDDDEDA
mmetsp:Transcript_13047/g.19535  ORF Transcript_13047/g.19535 Transcript_13047/m.19535 type:complete len:84 (+) Transcript_13047:751-1002(+)